MLEQQHKSAAGPQSGELPAPWLPQKWKTLKEVRVRVSLPLQGDRQVRASSPAESGCRPFMGPESPVLSSQQSEDWEWSQLSAGSEPAKFLLFSKGGLFGSFVQ